MILLHEETGSAYKLIDNALFSAPLFENGGIDNENWSEVYIEIIATSPIHQLIYEKLKNWN